MMNGKQSTKILRIDNGRGQYSLDGINYYDVDNLTKEDINRMLLFIIYNDVTFDSITESNKISNKAQEIIYSSVFEKFIEINNKKKEILQKIESDFSEAEKKYVIDKNLNK